MIFVWEGFIKQATKGTKHKSHKKKKQNYVKIKNT